MKEELAKIAEDFELSTIIAFGSYAKNTQHQKSDIDLAVVFEKKLDLRTELELRYQLSKLFNREVDLVDFHRSPPLLLGEIAKNSKLLYGDQAKYNHLRVSAIKQYLDFKPYLKLREKMINQR